MGLSSSSPSGSRPAARRCFGIIGPYSGRGRQRACMPARPYGRSKDIKTSKVFRTEYRPSLYSKHASVSRSDVVDKDGKQNLIHSFIYLFIYSFSQSVINK